MKLVLAVILFVAVPGLAAAQLWTAGVEGGNLNEWTLNDCGGEFNSGVADTVASTEESRSGNYSAKLTWFGPGDSATRLFRWCEPQRNTELYYSAWFFFPRTYRPGLYWNIFQWKSKTSSVNDPFFILNIANRTDGNMYFYLYDWQRRASNAQTKVNVPVGRWFQVEAYYRCAADNTGRVIFWQDGQLLFDVTNLSTRYGNGDCQWSLNSYSDSITPGPASYYIDDVSISPSRLNHIGLAAPTDLKIFQ